MDKIKIPSLIAVILLFIYSCTSNPYNVSKDDSQIVLNTDTGTIIDIVPVKIKGKTSDIGAAVGGAIGGIIAEDIGSGRGTDIAIIAGTTIGGVIGYYSTVKLGEHNGFQYVISIDGEDKPIGVVQGTDKDNKSKFKLDDKVTIVYGEQVRVLPINKWKNF